MYRMNIDNDKMVSVEGIGWVNKQSYGCVRLNWDVTIDSEAGFLSLGKDDSIFERPVRNFGRFDNVSKLTCCACALALKDASIDSSLGCRKDIGLLGTSESACQIPNEEYFKDYIDCGRTLARGNLFIYTLPSSSIAEAAIHLGLGGPTLYISGLGDRLSLLVDQASEMIRSTEVAAMLIVEADQDSAVCFVLSDKDDIIE